MARKQSQRAVCPQFIARVDYLGKSAIHCQGATVAYADRQARDEAYTTACCGDPAQCPAKLRPGKSINTSLWPKRPGDPIQEGRNHD